jgi:hypothetical protein
MSDKNRNIPESVKFMRERREELSKEYQESPSKFRQSLESIRSKYRKLFGKTEKHIA